MPRSKRLPPSTDSLSSPVTRRDFLQTSVAAGVALSAWPVWAEAKDAPKVTGSPETLVKKLFDSLNEAQRKEVCFAWDYVDPKRGLLRTRVANNWNITKPIINSDAYTDDQRAIIKGIFEGMIQPDWHARFYKQLDDDAGGFGEEQSFAIFGEPGSGKFEFVMTGRHMTIRCDGDSADHVAFGGPIFYGHACEGFYEKGTHDGNVFWHQGLAANKLYEMLDGKHRKVALIEKAPAEQQVAFHGKSTLSGLPVTELSADQKGHLQKVLQLLVEPYRQSDRDEVAKCLKSQGGLDACTISFYQKDNKGENADVGNDGVWDNWRLEGPSFVWNYRGAPHVHVWVNIADDSGVKTNS